MLRQAAMMVGWALSAGMGLAEDQITVAGHDITVSEDGAGMSALRVDGAAMHENGVIYLDPWPVTLGDVTVVTGAAGAGGMRLAIHPERRGSAAKIPARHVRPRVGLLEGEA